jgi:hypothetical protein
MVFWPAACGWCTWLPEGEIPGILNSPNIRSQSLHFPVSLCIQFYASRIWTSAIFQVSPSAVFTAYFIITKLSQRIAEAVNFCSCTTENKLYVGHNRNQYDLFNKEIIISSRMSVSPSRVASPPSQMAQRIGSLTVLVRWFHRGVNWGRVVWLRLLIAHGARHH